MQHLFIIGIVNLLILYLQIKSGVYAKLILCGKMLLDASCFISRQLILEGNSESCHLRQARPWKKEETYS